LAGDVAALVDRRLHIAHRGPGQVEGSLAGGDDLLRRQRRGRHRGHRVIVDRDAAGEGQRGGEPNGIPHIDFIPFCGRETASRRTDRQSISCILTTTLDTFRRVSYTFPVRSMGDCKC
jgi:hypothetical protein